jgi:hypothetical protein
VTTAVLASLAGAGCEDILGIKPATLYQPDASTGGASTSSNSASTGTASTTGGTGGAGGSAPQPAVLAHFANAQVEAVATDAATGAIYISGKFSGTAAFGTTVFNSAGGTDMFIAKLDATGNVAWAKQIGGSKDDDGLSLAYRNHAVTVVGHTSGGASFDGHTVPSASSFFVRYNEDGSLRWVSECTGGGQDVAIDSTNDNAVVAGSFMAFQCGTHQYFPQGDLDIEITRLASIDGSQAETQTFGGGEFNYAHTVAVDNFSNILFGGRVDSMTTIGPYQLPINAMYVAKLHSSTTVPWAKSLGDGATETVATDASGDVLAYGTCFDSNNEFGGPSKPALGNGSTCVAKLSGNDGSYLWARRFGSPMTQAPSLTGLRLLAVNSVGDVAISGLANGPLSFDGHPVTQAGFVTSFTGSTGAVNWVNSLGFTTAYPAFSTNDALVLAGTFGPGTIAIGTDTLATAPAQTDSFVAIITP